MRVRPNPHSASFVDRYLQARRLLPSDAPPRARRQRSDQRAIEAVTRAIRGSKA